MKRERVMIAGVGGASLGSEIAKSLRLSGSYEIFGCDISETAFGLYSPDFDETFHVDRDNYINSVIEVCRSSGSAWIIPGGEQPMVLLARAADQFLEQGIRPVGNSPELVRAFSDKLAAFDRLKSLGIPIPETLAADSDESIAGVGFPCIVKPATGSGGSAFTFLAADMVEARLYVTFIRNSGYKPLIQEYIDVNEGEFTVGVLSLPDSTIVGSIALRRSLDAKLSVAFRGKAGVISSGYSQGYIGDFPEARRAAEVIAKAIGSRGPINVQGRFRKGCFVPFEINPRFSASTYLRALAGFNEVDIFIQFLATGRVTVPPVPMYGWYLRTLAEIYVAPTSLK